MHGRLRIVPHEKGTWKIQTKTTGKDLETGINDLGKAYARMVELQRGRWVRVGGRSVFMIEPGPKPSAMSVGAGSPAKIGGCGNGTEGNSGQ